MSDLFFTADEQEFSDRINEDLEKFCGDKDRNSFVQFREKRFSTRIRGFIEFVRSSILFVRFQNFDFAAARRSAPLDSAPNSRKSIPRSLHVFSRRKPEFSSNDHFLEISNDGTNCSVRVVQNHRSCHSLLFFAARRAQRTRPTTTNPRQSKTNVETFFVRNEFSIRLEDEGPINFSTGHRADLKRKKRRRPSPSSPRNRTKRNRHDLRPSVTFRRLVDRSTRVNRLRTRRTRSRSRPRKRKLSTRQRRPTTRRTNPKKKMMKTIGNN